MILIIAEEFEDICLELEYNPNDILSRRTDVPTVQKRWRVANRLKALGFNPRQIAHVMGRHRTSVLYMLSTEEEREAKRARARKGRVNGN